MFRRVLKSYGSKEKKKGSKRAICPRAIYPRPTNDTVSTSGPFLPPHRDTHKCIHYAGRCPVPVHWEILPSTLLSPDDVPLNVWVFKFVALVFSVLYVVVEWVAGG